jgi:AcrR family transcriptional regulator
VTPLSPIAAPGTHASEGTRPRVEGDREQEIFDATLHVLEEVGYDRLTMDAVATAARASKATLYRRWNGKVALVIDALLPQKGPQSVPDTGTLRGDLLATFCGVGGLTDHSAVALFASVLTAISRDAEFATAFRERVVGPKAAAGRLIFERARDRGELRDGVDLDLLAPALAGICLHRLFLMGLPPDQDTIRRVVDQIILPAALAPAAAAEPASSTLQEK